MRLLLAALLLFQSGSDLKPRFQKFDRVTLAMTIQTEIRSSNGRDSKYTLEMDVVAEVEKTEGDAVFFDGGASALKISGTLNGKAVDYEWRKGGTERGEKVAAIQKGLEKGWKVTLSGTKGLSMGDEALEFFDALPVLNPAALLGLAAPLPPGSVQVGKGWEAKDLEFTYFTGFRLRYSSSLNHLEKDVAKISSRLVFSRPDSDVPIEGAAQVKGDGDASMEFDVKSGRPVKGATSIRLTTAQGGLKREVTQIIEFEAKR